MRVYARLMLIGIDDVLILKPLSIRAGKACRFFGASLFLTERERLIQALSLPFSYHGSRSPHDPESLALHRLSLCFHAPYETSLARTSTQAS